mmetsp:Transcript_28956/g.72197  ORF Transcript_28956/g.72197 Transcript_28956/m.72197 type:complete len:121 (+) Transcript_28956:451-813(+)
MCVAVYAVRMVRSHPSSTTMRYIWHMLLRGCAYIVPYSYCFGLASNIELLHSNGKTREKVPFSHKTVSRSNSFCTENTVSNTRHHANAPFLLGHGSDMLFQVLAEETLSFCKFCGCRVWS